MKALSGTQPSPASRILLMEDELSVAQGLQDALQEEGYAVDLAGTGKGALEQFRRKDFDLLMADLRLPDMDGMEVVKAVKKKRPQTAVIVFTGYASVESAVAAMKLGAADYLAKPFTADEIKASVNGIFKSAPMNTAPVAEKSTTPGSRPPFFKPMEAGRRPQILLMEDEASLAGGLKMILSEAGYDVALAMTGAGALDTFSGNGFDVLVADLRLPDIDGMEVIKQVKTEKPDTGVVVITGYATVSSAVEAMKLGVKDYLPKPFTEQEVITAVQGALKSRHQAAIRSVFEGLDTEDGKLIQQREVRRVLDRASQDDRFWRSLTETGSEALSDYALSLEAKAAIVSGDLNWIRKHVGDLTDAQLQWILSRLEMERW